jgi:hypothetical protein
MEVFFNWASTLSQTELINYILVVIGIMLIIPYWNLLLLLFKKIIRLQSLSINSFEYQIKPKVLIREENSEYIDLSYNKQDFILEGGKVILIWDIVGALHIKINQGIGKVKGNVAEVIVSKTRRSFILEAKGLFSKKQIELIIPEEKIKTLATEKVSQIVLKNKLKLDNSNNSLFNFNKPINTKLIYQHNKLVQLQIQSILSQSKNQELTNLRRTLTSKIASQKISKFYNFSTNKYNLSHQLKPIKFNEYE